MGEENMDRKTYYHYEKQLRIELLLEEETFLSYVITTKLDPSLINSSTVNTYPIPSNWQWMGGVHVSFAIIARLPITKYLHLEVPHHCIYYLP